MSISKVPHGYQVRLMRHRKIYTKFFKRKRDAQQYERELKRRLGPPQSPKGVPRGPVKTNTGIRRIVEGYLERDGRRPVRVFKVYWTTPKGRTRCSTVSIEKHGRDKALRRAKRIKRRKDAVRFGPKPKPRQKAKRQGSRRKR